MLNVHKAMRDKSDRNAAEHRKACIDAEVQLYVEDTAALLSQHQQKNTQLPCGGADTRCAISSSCNRGAVNAI